MALQTFVEDVTTLDEAVQPLYKEVEGGYLLETESVNGYALENVAGLQSALAKERKSASDNEKSIKTLKAKYDGVDLEEVEANKTKLEELSNFDPEKEADKLASVKFETNKKRYEKALNTSWESKWESEVKPLESKYAVVKSQLERQLVTAEAIKAIASEGGDTDLLLPHVVSKIKLNQGDDGMFNTYVVDDTGSQAYNLKAQEMSVDELVSTLKPKFPAAFKSDVKPGGGKDPSNSGMQQTIKPENMTPAQKIAEGLRQRAS